MPKRLRRRIRREAVRLDAPPGPGGRAGRHDPQRSEGLHGLQERRRRRSGSEQSAITAGVEQASEAPEWAKLNLHEFKDLPEFDTIKEIIGSKLEREALQHEFFDEGEKSYLIFRVDDAPEVARCFDELATETTRACKKAEQQLSKEKGRAAARDGETLGDPDKEPLQDRVEAFRKSAELAERAHGRSREVIDQARGR